MKNNFIFFLVAGCFVLTSCAVGKGCPSNGRNVGAEKVLSGDAKTMKAIKKARKFRA
jgi:hypothetical protein